MRGRVTRWCCWVEESAVDSAPCRVRQGAVNTAQGGLEFLGPAAGASVAALAASRGAGPVCSVNLLCRVGGVPRSDGAPSRERAVR